MTRDRTAFVFRRIALPDRLLKDGWWLESDKANTSQRPEGTQLLAKSDKPGIGS